VPVVVHDIGPRNRVGVGGWRRACSVTFKSPFWRVDRTTNPMTKILLAVLALAMMTGAALAQLRTHYDSRGNVVGRSATDSQGSTTNYDGRGRGISRESTSGNTTTIYDASGRNVGRFTTNH